MKKVYESNTIKIVDESTGQMVNVQGYVRVENTAWTPLISVDGGYIEVENDTEIAYKVEACERIIEGYLIDEGIL